MSGANKLPLTEGVWAKLTPKTSIAEGYFSLRIRTVAAYDAMLVNGPKAYEGWENTNNTFTTAQNYDEVAAWCSQSPTVAIVIDNEGNSEKTQVDFGGNGDEMEDLDRAFCEFICWIFGGDPDENCHW